MVFHQPPGQLEQQDDVDGVQQKVRQVKTEGCGPPQRAVERKRQVGDRAHHVAQDDRANVRDAANRGIVDDRAEVVVHEWVVKRVEVDGSAGQRGATRGDESTGLEARRRASRQAHVGRRHEVSALS